MKLKTAIQKNKYFLITFKEDVLMIDYIYTLDEITEKVKPIAEKYSIEKVWVFGSYAKDIATPKSEINILICAPHIKRLFALGCIYGDFEDIFQKEINLVTEDNLHKAHENHLQYIFDEITETKTLIYENDFSFNDLVKQITDKFAPEKIFLFGSRAKGTATKNSDIDLCVIMDTTDKRKTISDMYCSIECNYPIDLLLYTPSEWKRCVLDETSFAYLINAKGVILYSK